MLRRNVLDRVRSLVSSGQRSRHRLVPEVRPLEGRRLLAASAAGTAPASAVMTQTATFPNLEALPDVSTQAFLYFRSTMGTLTEVDVVTSGSFNSEFYAENLGASSSTLQGTTSGNLSVQVPSGSIPVVIPSVTRTFDAQPFDGALDYAGTSGKDFTPVTSSSAPQTTVLTSPADLAAFTGNFRMPISVSGHATGTATSENGQLSSGFHSQTSATITVIYHFIPDLPSLDPSPATSPEHPADQRSRLGPQRGRFQHHILERRNTYQSDRTNRRRPQCKWRRPGHVHACSGREAPRQEKGGCAGEVAGPPRRSSLTSGPHAADAGETSQRRQDPPPT